MIVIIRLWLLKSAISLSFGLLLLREPIASVSKANWPLVISFLFAFMPNEEKLPTNWNYLRTSPEFTMSSTFLNSGVASRILSVEWTTKRLIFKITSRIESTPFVSSIKPSVPLDVIISSFSRFNGHTIPRKRPLGKRRIVFDSSTPPSSRRILNLGTRFFWVGVSCHTLLSCHTLASHALECCIMFTLSAETWNGDDRTPSPLWNQLGLLK